MMSAFLLRFKANYLEKMRGYPLFSLWIPIALAKIYFSRVVLTWRKKPLYLVGTVLKAIDISMKTLNKKLKDFVLIARDFFFPSLTQATTE